MTAYYAIRHKPTGRFMPETRKGYSYWSPADVKRLSERCRFARAIEVAIYEGEPTHWMPLPSAPKEQKS